ncbi:MAG: DUF5723 family protein [Prolixibacteraceae bacterium]
MKIRYSEILKFSFQILFTIMILQVKAQPNLILYHSIDHANSSNNNPAFLTSQEKFTFSIFPISGMSTGYNNQVVINDMLLKVLRGDTAKAAFKDVFNGLVNRGLFYQSFESSLLSIGYNSDYGAFNFRIKEVELIMNNFKGDFTRFLLDPDFITIPMNLEQHMPAELLHYREYSLGYAKEIIENKLTLGIRAKVYFGKAAFVSEVSGYTENIDNSYYLKTKGSLKLSAPVNTVINDEEVLQPFVLQDNFSAGNYLLNTKNMGTGIDLGLTYQINNQILISASVVDLGKINWKNNLNSTILKGEILFEQEFINSSGDNFLTKNSGFTIDNNFDLFKVDSTKIAFSTSLPANYYLGFQYKITPELALGVVNRYIYKKDLSQYSLSLAAKYDVKPNISISSGYSIIGNSFFNIPFGIVYQWNRGQTFFATDNLFSFIIPSISDFTEITFGTCFYLFRGKEKYKEQEYFPFYQEKKRRSVK